MHLTFLSYLLSLLTETTDYVLGFFIKENLQEASFLMNLTSHAIKRRQFSIEGNVDLHVVVECLKKNEDTLRSKQANNLRDPRIILKLLSSRQHEQRA